MAQIRPELKAFIAARLPDGLDARDVAEIAREIATS